MLISIVCCKCHTISFIGVWLQSDDCTWKKCVVVVFRHWIYANKCDYFVAHSADALRTKLSNFKNCQHHTTISISIQFTSIASVMNMEWFCWFVFFFRLFHSLVNEIISFPIRCVLLSIDVSSTHSHCHHCFVILCGNCGALRDMRWWAHISNVK